jgi:hypothetical protein
MEVTPIRITRRWMAAGAACALLCGGIDCCPAQTSSSSAAERLEVFQWFSGLGFPDVKDGKFVRFAAGSSQVRGQPVEVSYRHGFLTDKNKKSWTILTLGLSSRTIEKAPGPPEVDATRWTCVPENFAAFAAATSHEPRGNYGPLDSEFDDKYSKTTRKFLIAWMCWRRGLEQPAAEWFDRATRSVKDTPDKNTPAHKLRRQVTAELAREDLQNAEIDLGNPEIGRDKVLERLIRLDGKYPGVPAAARAQKMAIVLKQMVREDREHALREKQDKPFAQRSRSGQVAELIFQLREQGGDGPWSMHSSIDIFAGNRRWRHKKTAAHNNQDLNAAKQLAEIGYDAVPQLVEALSDDRLSRALDVRHRLVMSKEESPYYVLTVGDCALRILERISGQTFWEARDEYISESPAGLATVRRAVDAWNLTLQRNLKLKGERDVLAEAIQAGDWKKIPLAERLVASYPESALPALASAAANSTETIAQSELVKLMGKVPGERTLPFLLTEVRKSRSLYVRVEIAWLLQDRGRREAFDAMLDEWKVAATKVGDPSLAEVAFFLGACRKLEAVHALAANLDKRPPDVRLAVLAAFTHRERMGGSGSSTRFFDVLFHRRWSSFDLETPVVTSNDTPLVGPVVDLLVSELDDTESLGDIEGDWNEKKFAHICIGDVAARALNQLDAARFPFDISADQARRAAARADIRNTWRNKHGLPPIVEPKPHEITAIPASTMDPLLDRLQKSSAADREVVTSEIERLGPGAVVEIFKRRDRLKANDPIRAVLDRTGRRLANTVVEVQFGNRSLKPDQKVADRLARLKSEPLDSARFQNLVVGLAKDLSKPARAFRLNVIRKGAASGIVLRLDLLDKPRTDAAINVRWPVPNDAPKDQPYAWYSGIKCHANGNSIFQVFGAAHEFPDSSLASMADDAFHVDLSQRLEIDIEANGMWRD